MSILVTGGAGYIGSHTCIELINAGYEIIIVDNLCNTSYKLLNRVEYITNSNIKFYQVDLLEYDLLLDLFKKENIQSVIHFAG